MRLPRFTQGINSAPKKLATAIAFATGSSVAFSQGLVLEEIVVTATKKDEMVQDVPTTVNVITSDKMKELNVFNFKDVETLTPGLSLTNIDSRNNSISMRGVSFNPDSRASAAVVVYLNAVPIRPDVAFQQMYDLSRVEILRGPQGTLQGETSPAGSIQMYSTRANVDVVDGEVIQTFSDNGGVNTQFGASLPIVEGVFGIRAAGVYDEQETGAEKDDSVGGTVGTKDTKAGRFSASFLPTDDLDMHLTYQYMETRADGFNIVEGADDYAGGANPALDYSDRKSLQEGPSDIFNRAEFASFEVNYAFLDHLLTSVTGYQETKAYADQDKDSGNIIADYSQNQVVDTDLHRFTQEIRITNTEAEFWEYTGGLFFQKSSSYTTATSRGETNALNYDGSGPATVGGLTGSTVSNIPIDTENYGAFLDNKFYLSDVTTLGFGVRWQKTRSASKTDVFYDETWLFNGSPIGRNSGEPVDVGGDNSVDANGVANGNNLIPQDNEVQKGIAWTGGIKLSHDLNEEVMVYAAYDRSYRPGGFAISPDAEQITSSDLIFTEETSNAVEFGFKSTLENGRYQINGAVFMQEFKDYISRASTVLVDSTTPPLGGGTANFPIAGGLTYNGDAVVQGAELEFTGVLTENWTAFLGASYTDSKFDGAEQPCGQTGDSIPAGQSYPTCTTSGRIGPEPNWSISASSEYTIPLGEMDGFVRGLYKFNDNRVDENAGYNLGGYGLFDLFVGVRGGEGAWEVSAWSKNLFDKEARVAIGEPQVQAVGSTILGGYDVVSVVPERTIGITGKYKFGAF